LFTKKPSVKPKKKYYQALLGLCVYFLIVGLVYFYLSSKQIVRWPFHTVHTASEAYHTTFEYFPAFIIALLSQVWLRLSGIPITELFRWKRLSKIFYLGVIGSIIYSVHMLKPIHFGVHVYFLWPPVLILSILNAVTEEIVFRVVLFSLLNKLIDKTIVSNLIQSAAYAAIHIFIVGPVFAAQAFALGIALGVIMEENKSVIPCIVCHFFVDLGAIGYPILCC
jgi:membrane protease YdiL (CAAX protease family)